LSRKWKAAGKMLHPCHSAMANYHQNRKNFLSSQITLSGIP
jgi:hypothetical protein